MSVAESAPRRWKRPPLIKNPRLRWGLGLGAAVYLAFAIGSIPVNWARAYAGLDRGWAFVIAFTEPDFVTRWRDISDGLIESLTMTVTSTVLGILLSIPIGLGAARNLAPCRSTWSAAPSSPWRVPSRR